MLANWPEIKHNKHINNLTQKAFIAIIINNTFSVFATQNNTLKKILTLRIK